MTREFNWKTLLHIALGALLAIIMLSYTKNAHALNGFTYTTICSGCRTTAQFTTAAVAAAQRQLKAGTYTMISTSVARTATIKVTGSYCGCEGTPQLVGVTTTPIDSSGNSLAGSSESAQESYYGALDQTFFGAPRSTPAYGFSNTSYFPSAFAGTTDLQMSSAIDEYLQSYGISVGPGSVFTVMFGNGDRAEFVAQAPGVNPPWKWNNHAWNSKNQMIDRTGKVIPNPNTAGAGGGTPIVPSVGDSSDSWPTIDLSSCTVSVTVDIGGVSYSVGGFLVPC